MANRGCLVVVVGASGVGKDTLIDFSRKALVGRKNYEFVQRYITRPADSGGEDHVAVTELEFHKLAASGGFAVDWSAHGLLYGVPVSARRHVDEGGIAILNGSRKALPAIVAAFSNVRTVEITASNEIRAERLAARGREAAVEISARLQRSVAQANMIPIDFTIENNGGVDRAGDELVRFLIGLTSGR